jgi:hypothetical protein
MKTIFLIASLLAKSRNLPDDKNGEPDISDWRRVRKTMLIPEKNISDLLIPGAPMTGLKF